MAKSLKGPHIQLGEVWIEIDRLPGAREYGWEPVETVWFSESGWRREEWRTPGCLADQGVDLSWAIGGKAGPRPEWTSPPEIPFRAPPSPFQGPEFDWREND